MSVIPGPFAKKLYKIRRVTGAEQKAFAKAIGVSLQWYNDIESGRRAPSLKFVRKLELWLQEKGIPNTRGLHLLAAREHGWEI